MIHRFPNNSPPCSSVVIDVIGNELFLKFDGKNSRSKRQPSKISREPRKTEIRAIFSGLVHLTEIRVPKAGAIQFVGKPHSVLELRDTFLTPLELDLVCYYERKSKRKIINAVFLNNDSSAINANVALARYDRFYACDANTWKFLETGKFSVCVVFQETLGAAGGEHRPAEFSKVCTITIEGDVEGNPELHAARQLIIDLQQRMFEKNIKPIGIIMDSELGRLKEINARRAPLIADFYLPEGFEIMYASDATGSAEFLANALIRMCDKSSNEILTAHQTNNNLTRALEPE